jgi:predicted RNase H-like HicB family nuclease
MTMQPRELVVRVVFEDGSYWATVDEFPGVFAAGDSVEELRTSLEDGISLYISDASGGVKQAVQLAEFEPPAMATTASAGLVYA